MLSTRKGEASLVLRVDHEELLIQQVADEKLLLMQHALESGCCFLELGVGIVDWFVELAASGWAGGPAAAISQLSGAPSIATNVALSKIRVCHSLALSLAFVRRASERWAVCNVLRRRFLLPKLDEELGGKSFWSCLAQTCFGPSWIDLATPTAFRPPRSSEPAHSSRATPTRGRCPCWYTHVA